MQHHQIDINRADIAVTEEQWRNYIYQEIHRATPSPSPSPSIIHSVPLVLYNVRPQSYQPKAVTIGPLWRQGFSFTSKMDKCKALCVNEFMKRRDILTIEGLISYILGAAPASVDVNNLHNLYHGHSYSNETIKLMLSIDLVFLHEFLLFYNAEMIKKRARTYNETVETYNPAEYLSAFVPHDIAWNEWVNDLFKIGNQVPLKLLEGLVNTTQELSLANFENRTFEMAKGKYPFTKSTSSFDDSLSYHDFLVSLLPQRDCTVLHPIPPNFHGEHLLDRLYNMCVQPLPTHKKSEFKFQIPTASELIKVGIKFKPSQYNISRLDYDKRNLVIYLPRLEIVDNTEEILRNLVTYEQTSIGPSESFSIYVLIMDYLINTKDDLAILYKSQVLENHVGSDEKVLSMWNDIALNIIVDTTHQWAHIMNDIQKTYRSPWREIYIEFHNKFLSRPWLWASTIGALLLLVMTLLQTIFAIKV